MRWVIRRGGIKIQNTKKSVKKNEVRGQWRFPSVTSTGVMIPSFLFRVFGSQIFFFRLRRRMFDSSRGLEDALFTFHNFLSISEFVVDWVFERFLYCSGSTSIMMTGLAEWIEAGWFRGSIALKLILDRSKQNWSKRQRKQVWAWYTRRTRVRTRLAFSVWRIISWLGPGRGIILLSKLGAGERDSNYGIVLRAAGYNPKRSRTEEPRAQYWWWIRTRWSMAGRWYVSDPQHRKPWNENNHHSSCYIYSSIINDQN